MLNVDIDFRTHKWAIFFCSVSAIGALAYGYDNTYYNGVLAMQPFKDNYGTQFDEHGNRILEVSFTSLTASSIYIGDLLGAMMSAPINDKWGRKAVFLSASICILLGGIAHVADTHYEGVLVVGRIFVGLGVGQFTVTSLLYIGEVAPLEIRGPALMMFQFLQSCAQLVAAGISQGTAELTSSLSYKIPMGGLIIIPLMMFAGLPFIPESPVWYIFKGRREDAQVALRKINKGNPAYDPTEDLASLDEARTNEINHAESSTYKAMFSNPIERKKILWSSGAMYSQQICGILFFYVYGVVFAQAIGIKEPFMIQLATNILQIFAVAFAVITGNKIRRRTNLLVTTGMMFVAFLIIGGIGTHKTLSTTDQYVIVVFSFVIIVAFNVGLGPLAYTVCREMAVGVNQSKIMSFSIVIFYLCTWLVSFTAPYLYYSAGLGPMVCFLYAGTTVTSLLWCYFCVGETTGRSALEINMFFQQGIPARKWRTHVFPESLHADVSGKEYSVDKKESSAEYVSV